MKVIATLVLTLVLCATAAARATHGSTRQSSFCGTAQGVAKYLKNTLTLSANGVVAQTPANLKTTYTTVAKAEGPLLASAPASLKPNLRNAFAFLNLVKSDFEKADWQAAKMAPYFPTLAAKARANAKPIAAVKSYLNRTCHISI